MTGTEPGAPVKHRTPPQGPYLKTALALLALGLCGMVLVLPYATTLESKAVTAAAMRRHMTPELLLAISIAQSVIFVAIAVFAGLWAARKLGLRTPLLTAYFTGAPTTERTGTTLLLAVAAGVATGFALIALDRWMFAPLPSIAAFIASANSTGIHPPVWQGFLASFYGAFDEEILMRLGLLSLLALAFRTIARMFGANRDVALPTGVFWAANVVAAVLFGLGHLPATAALAPLTAELIVRAVVLNGMAGIVFGVLYKRYGLEWAMVSHFAGDIVLHVVFG